MIALSPLLICAILLTPSTAPIATRRVSLRRMFRIRSAAAEVSSCLETTASISDSITPTSLGMSSASSPNQEVASGIRSSTLATMPEEDNTRMSRSAAPDESRSILKNHGVSPSSSLRRLKLKRARSGSVPSAIQRIKTGKSVR